MDDKEIELKKKIINARESIKRKYAELKRSKMATERFITETYKPIVRPLEKMAGETKPIYEIKSEPKSELTFETPRASKIPKLTPRMIEKSSDEEESADDDYHKKYIKMLKQDTQNRMDTTYGVHLDTLGQNWQIGNKLVEFDSEYIIIDGQTFRGTDGLYQLIFMKVPENYNVEDLQLYKNILELTSAHKRNYNPYNQMAGNRSVKYTTIIAPLFAIVGSGLIKEVTNKHIEYVYWDNPSELVQRLQLLYASKMAGNTSHENEIISIIEELREADIIV